ncbi:MAG: hypothetical protein Kow00121_52880 [Elainellaceae cyanobacterium]
MPLYLHRPAMHYRESFWWTDVDMMPFKLVKSSISYFEFKQPIAEIEIDTLLEFCDFNQIKLETAQTQAAIAKKIVLWQISVIENLGCFQVSMDQFIEIYHYARATPRRKTFREDICWLIETTGEMSLEGLWSNLSLYVLTHCGIQQVLFVEVDRNWNRNWGRFHTSTSSISSYADLPIWIERRQAIDRQTLQAMVKYPKQFWRLKGATSNYKRSAAFYELEKYIWVLNTRLGETVASNSQSVQLLLQYDVRLINESEIRKALRQANNLADQVLEFGQTEPGERVGLVFTGDNEWIYNVPLLWAGAIALAYFNWAKQVRESQDTMLSSFKKSDAIHDDSFTASVEAASFAVFEHWLNQLKILVPVSKKLVKEIQQAEKMVGLPEVIKNQLMELV